MLALKYFNSFVETHPFKHLEVIDVVLTDVLDQVGVNNYAFLLHPFCVRKSWICVNQGFAQAQYFSCQINRDID
jgi:hypothetical protein